MKARGFGHFVRNHARGISHKQKNNFFRQLAILTGAGISIVKALKMLSRSSRGNMKYLINDAVSLIEQGHSFSKIGVYYTVFFDKTTIAMINAGEKSGNLPAIFRQIYENLDKKNKFKSKIKGAMMMPLFTLVFAIGVIFFMALKVIPEFAKFLSSMGADMPPLTQAVLDVSNFIIGHWQDILTYGVGAILGIVTVYMTLRPIRHILDYVLIYSPLVGPIALNGTLSRFASNMAKLVGSGVGLVESLNIANEGVLLLPFKKVINNAKSVIVSGGSFSEPFGKARFVPLIFSDILQAGEESGNLDETLEQLAIIYEEEANIKISILQTAIQPIMTVLIGGLVGVVAASLIMGMIAMWAANG